MTDIVERLHTIRDHLHSGRFGQREVWEKDLDEAADEIERLRAEAAEWKERWEAERWDHEATIKAFDKAMNEGPP